MRLRFLSFISLFVGIALFFYLLNQSGTAEIFARVRALGWGFLLILGISALRQFARAFAWLRCMSDDARSVGFFAVLRARLAGDALADLTAAGPVIGEPIKIAKLKGQASLSDLASSLAVENLAYAVSACLMILAGTLSLLSFFALNDSLKQASWITVFVVTAILLFAFLVVKMRWHLASDLAAKISPRLKFLANKLHRVQELETYTFDFYAKRTPRFSDRSCLRNPVSLMRRFGDFYFAKIVAVRLIAVCRVYSRSSESRYQYCICVCACNDWRR